jgi:hypothetical protein
MADITKDAAELSSRINALDKEREECLKLAKIKENEAGALRVRADECKTDRAAAQVALSNLNVRRAVESAEAVAAKASASAQEHEKKTAAELEAAKKLREEAEATLSRLKAAEEKAKAAEFDKK